MTPTYLELWLSGTRVAIQISISAGDGDLFNCILNSSCPQLSLSFYHCPNITEILLRKMDIKSKVIYLSDQTSPI